MISTYKTDSTEALAAIATPGQKNIWIHGSTTYVSTGDDYTPPPAPEQHPQQPQEQ